jgi:thymidylate kinase
MLIAIEGLAGSGKSSLRDHLLGQAHNAGVKLTHVGQFSWLSLHATRTIIGLRAGHNGVSETEAVTAVLADLRLHARHTIALARTSGHVVADRLLLSSACLLSLIYGTDPKAYLERLAAVDHARPEMTILLTTPPGLCTTRLQQRATARRFGEQPETANRLAALYQLAADAWDEITGLATIRGPSASSSDAERLSGAALDSLRPPRPGA